MNTVFEERLEDCADELLGEKRPHPPAALASRDPLDWMEAYELSSAEAEQIADPTWIEPGLVAAGHVVAIVAKPNGGKTTIVFHLACGWADVPRTVVYVDADTNPSDAKRKLQLARKHGVRYLTPDLKIGKSMHDIVKHLEKLAASDTDLAGHVWIFDTLKKMTNVIHKDALRKVLSMLRKLSARGMTVVLLAHTNKYKNAEGEFQYEGTGDLESDVDELIYFEPTENDDRSLTVSTRCTKRRANIANMTWTIRPDRSVERLDGYVDVAAERRQREQLEEDEVVIELVRECLTAGPRKQREVVEHCAPCRITPKRVRTVLKRYRGRFWLEAALGKDNAKEYRLMPPREERRAYAD
jgi:KaiC/GvpD/RAD55 family RecA-like ATPase